MSDGLVWLLRAQDPRKRATADEILRHGWMRENGTASDAPLDNVILARMRGFAGMNRLKREALRVIAAGMSPEEIAGLRALFQVRAGGRAFPPCSTHAPQQHSASILMQ